MKSLRNDLRLALRMLTKSPLFTVIVVATMAIAIGLNTTVFATVEALLLRPLPGATEPDRLVQLYRTAPGLEWGSNSIPHYFDVRERTRDVFADVATWTFAPLNIAEGDRPQQHMGQVVSANYFRTLGVRPARGRFFLPEEGEGRGAHPVIVLSDAGWRNVFGADQEVVGRSIRINGQVMEVVGVAPPRFNGVMTIFEPVGWVPLMQLEQLITERTGAFERRSNNFMNVIARLADGVSPEQATARLSAANDELAGLYPNDYENRGVRLIGQNEAGLHPSVRSAQVGLSSVVLGVVVVLLLVACVNVSNLFVARARDRAREMAIRLSLGATRGQLVRQLLVESVLFAALAGIVGLVVAVGSMGLLNQIELPIGVDMQPNLSLNPMVLGFTAGITMLAGVLFGLAPALQATRPSLVPALKGEAPAGGGRSRVRQGLIVAQMALSIVLLTCAGLFVSNLRTATTLDVGFQPQNAVTGSVYPSLQGYDRARAETFYRTLIERLEGSPGVQQVGMIDQLPMALGSSDRFVEIPGYEPAEGEAMNINNASTGPGYFGAMAISLQSGRAFTARDDSSATRVAIVNQHFVDRFFGGEDPTGKTFRTGGRDRTIIGVVPTGKYSSLGEDPTAFMYFPQAQEWASDMQLVVRGSLPSAQLLSTLRQEIELLDAQLPIVNLQTMTDHLGTALMPARLAGGALGLFGVIGLLLAGVGMYGVMAYSVGQRTREIGIRMALGASNGNVVRLVMGQGLRQVVIGCVIGLVGAGGAYALIRSVLYGSGSMTLATFVAAPLVLLAVATLALFVPARRAARLDPQIALRHD